METIICVIIAIYAIFLNIRIKEIEDDLYSCQLDRTDFESKVYKKMMDIRKEIKSSIKVKRVEKSRGGGTKRSRKVS